MKSEEFAIAIMTRRATMLGFMLWIAVANSSFFTIHFTRLQAQSFTFVELNCENLFDCRHDSLKQDMEFMPDGVRHWTRTKYWRKLNHIGQDILSCSDKLPDLVTLVEVENDTVLHDLTRRSLLRNAGYDYLMTQSADVRGIDVALLYQPASFRPICYEHVGVVPLKDMRPTRDILYVKGEVITGDTLHIMVVHAPSRYGGELETRPFRMQVVRTLAATIDSVRNYSPEARIVVAGDFNATANDQSLRYLRDCGLINATLDAHGTHGAPANYRYQGTWEQIDHILVSPSLRPFVTSSFVNDLPFLLEEDRQHGGLKPFRTFNGYRYQRGFSDHLPLVVLFSFIGS